jgi:TonB family protein
VDLAQRERAERVEREKREEAERAVRERAARAAENAKRQEAQRQEAQRQEAQRQEVQRQEAQRQAAQHQEAERQARAKAAEAAASNAAATSAYRTSVIGHLASFKRYPPAARARGAQGTPAVSFSIDASGRVVSVSLTHASGDPDIDAEIVAMVHRASPFPAPPPGAPHVFSAGVNFRLQ